MLREKKLASAMIDTSDGLSTDLTHICDESAVGAEIDASLSPGLAWGVQLRRSNSTLRSTAEKITNCSLRFAQARAFQSASPGYLLRRLATLRDPEKYSSPAQTNAPINLSLADGSTSGNDHDADQHVCRKLSRRRMLPTSPVCLYQGR